MTQGCRSSVVGTTAGVLHVISTKLDESTSHDWPPTATAAPLRCSKPTPLTVRIEPPPAEPAAGLTAVMAILCSKVRLVVIAKPTSGSVTPTGTTPGGALPTVHVTSVMPSAASEVVTEPQSVLPSVTSGVTPLSMRSMVRLSVVP